MNNAVDPAHGHDRPGTGSIERHRQFRLPPEQRKQGDDQPGTVRGEHRQHELDGVRQLNRDDGIGRQPRLDEMSRQRGDCAVGLRKRQAFWRLAGDALLVVRIEQRQRIRLPCKDASKQSVERWRWTGLNPGITSLAGSWVEEPAFATRFPGDTPSARWLPVVLSDSSARSIARRRYKAG